VISGIEGLAGRGAGVLTVGVEVAAVAGGGGDEADGVRRVFFLDGIAIVIGRSSEKNRRQDPRKWQTVVYFVIVPSFL